MYFYTSSTTRFQLVIMDTGSMLLLEQHLRLASWVEVARYGLVGDSRRQVDDEHVETIHWNVRPKEM